MAYTYRDARMEALQEEEAKALAQTDRVYSDLLTQTQENYEDLIAAEKEYGEKQLASQQEQADLEIEKLQQEQADALADYEEEQAAAYRDYKTQVNDYSPQQEKIADAGLSGSGYSESAKVSMYNAYQNRVALARQDFDQAMRDYDMAIREARQVNNAALAKIAYDTLKQQWSLTVKAMNEYFQLQLDWEDRHWDQEKYFRNWEAALRKEIQEYPDYLGVDVPKVPDQNSQIVQRG